MLCLLEAYWSKIFSSGLQPVAYESKKLSPTEMRYSAYESELLGIVWAIGKWRHYFEGRQLIVQTDHSSLTSLAESAQCEPQNMEVGSVSCRGTTLKFDISQGKSTLRIH